MACLSEKRHAAKVFPREEKLKLESHRKLNLAFTIQSAVGTGSLSERRIKTQTVRIIRNYSINIYTVGCAIELRRVDAESIGAIEDIEAFGKQFEIVSFGKSESFGKSNVQVLNVRLTESVSLINRQTSIPESSV